MREPFPSLVVIVIVIVIVVIVIVIVVVVVVVVVVVIAVTVIAIVAAVLIARRPSHPGAPAACSVFLRLLRSASRGAARLLACGQPRGLQELREELS